MKYGRRAGGGVMLYGPPGCGKTLLAGPPPASAACPSSTSASKRSRGAAGRCPNGARGAGRGFGHGVGLSQYGAYGFAQRGRRYEAILRHYYRGAELTKIRPRPTRVLIRRGYSTVSFRGAARIGDRRARPNVTYTARPGGPGVLLFKGRKRVGSFAAPLRVTHRGRAVQLLGKADTGVAAGRYRGELVLHPARAAWPW